MNRIAAITSQFGPRTGPFSLIREFSGGDGSVLEDRAIMATDGLITADSGLFRRPDVGHKSSPWFRLPLRLHSIASAQQRYDTWAADEFDRINDRDLGGWIDQQTGEMHPHPRPVNPYRERGVA